MKAEAPRAMVHYLTVQDILWINHAVTKEIHEFKHAQLEEATFFQYGYGKSEDVLGQAGAFLQGFIRLRPFTAGNRRTAFVAALTFLSINGYDSALVPEAAYEWAMDVANGKTAGVEAVKNIVQRSVRPIELKPTIRTTVHDVIKAYDEALAKLDD
jgi:death-on-curing protein